MGKRRTKQIMFFLTEEDEVNIAARLAERLPAAKLIDEWHWEEVDVPPVRDSPLLCDKVIGIWNSQVPVTGVARQNGTIDGPDGGAIVQWYRSRPDGSALKAGRWAAVYDESDVAAAEFVRALWRVINPVTTNNLVRTSGDPGGDRSERRFKVGEDALRQAAEGKISLVSDALVLAPA